MASSIASLFAQKGPGNLHRVLIRGFVTLTNHTNKEADPDEPNPDFTKGLWDLENNKVKKGAISGLVARIHENLRARGFENVELTAMHAEKENVVSPLIAEGLRKQGVTVKLVKNVDDAIRHEVQQLATREGRGHVILFSGDKGLGKACREAGKNFELHIAANIDNLTKDYLKQVRPNDCFDWLRMSTSNTSHISHEEMQARIDAREAAKKEGSRERGKAHRQKNESQKGKQEGGAPAAE